MLFYILMQIIPLDNSSQETLDFALYESKKDLTSGVVQISHGMAEHKDRYSEFTKFFNDHGYHVAIHDHRGHGTRILDKKIGHFSDKGGWNKVVNDLLIIQKELIKIFPSTPLILLGHSMGSWIALSALQKNTNYNAALISGSGYPNALETSFQKILNSLD